MNNIMSLFRDRIWDKSFSDWLNSGGVGLSVVNGPSTPRMPMTSTINSMNGSSDVGATGSSSTQLPSSELSSDCALTHNLQNQTRFCWLLVNEYISCRRCWRLACGVNNIGNGRIWSWSRSNNSMWSCSCWCSTFHCTWITIQIVSTEADNFDPLQNRVKFVCLNTNTKNTSKPKVEKIKRQSFIVNNNIQVFRNA